MKSPRSGSFIESGTDTPSFKVRRNLFKSESVSVEDFGAFNNCEVNEDAIKRGLSKHAVNEAHVI